MSGRPVTHLAAGRGRNGGSRPALAGGLVGVLLASALAGCGAAAGGDASAAGPGSPAGPPADAESPSPPGKPPGEASADPPPTPSASTLRGLWAAGDRDGAQIVYEFDEDGTFTRISMLSQERPDGTLRLQDVVEGTFRVDGDSLSLHPTRGAQTVDEPGSAGSDGPVSAATSDLPRETHAVQLRADGDALVLDPSDGPPVTLLRQGS